MVDPFSASAVRPAPSVEQLLVLLAQRDALIAAWRVGSLNWKRGCGKLQELLDTTRTPGLAKPAPKSWRRCRERLHGVRS